ncbi:Outer membrane protein assembly factor BamB, contains PQQ-like beta-propeller repeat [Haladaptatus litoreus]|uniref:Outer membrane protein assembly factor BamB, contains PQQ-like beta-propeller repeat n=1 Tax=Haladaptatus litoreus TaxID=553468 RepID=A0A1N7B6D8_9EURY|nr:PQQ-binding-like beta-propeller repeat protein [Haladaptatus litoreus]SIR46856.1 Outer membrane protein assembly factor BamB, contains PQQ-like beta-propeller repeat [Haladaptatus litoreus]
MGAVGFESTVAIAQDAPGNEEQPSGWTTRRGNPARTGAVEEDGPTPYPTTDWTMDPDGSLYDLEPIVADGTVYLPVTTDNSPSGNDGYVGAYDAETGTELWTQSELSAPRSPTVSSDMVYVATKVPGASESSETGLYALDRENGDIVWDRTNSPEWAPPVLVDGLLYTANRTGAVAVDPSTGETEWRTEDVGGIANGFDGQVSAVNGTVFLADGTALDAEDGSVQWQASSDRPLLGSHAADEERVYYLRSEYIRGDDDRVVLEARSIETGRIDWTYRSDDDEWDGRKAVTDNYVLIVEATEGTWAVKALDKGTGTVEWTSELPGEFIDDPSVGNGIVYVGGRYFPTDSDYGRAFVSALDATTGDHLWDYLLDSSDLETSPENPPSAETPIVADGNLYVDTYPAGSTFDYEYQYYSNFFALGPCDKRPDEEDTPNDDGKPDDCEEYERPEACIDVTSNRNVSEFDAGETVWLNGFCSTGSDLTYEWDSTEDGQSDENGTSFPVTIPECGTVTVSLTVTDSKGNSDTTDMAVSAT